jgi:hypothetical protein
MTNDVEVPQPTEHELFAEGMQFVDDALSRFMELTDEHSEALSRILHGALVLAEMVYAIRKK